MLATVGLLLILASSTFSNPAETISREHSCNPLKIVIDTDGGIDDAHAIFGFLTREKSDKCGSKVVAITCVNGNTGAYNTTVNVMRILNEVNRTDIPVYKGAEGSLIFTPPYEHYFGSDGFGDVFTDPPDNMHLVKPEHAVNALLDIVNKNPEEITLVTIGPLTNLALAVRLDLDFIGKLKSLYIMGSVVEGVGNMAPSVEFNTLWDPEAAHIVYNDTHFKDTPVYLVPWEAVFFSEVDCGFRKNELGKLDCKEIKFLNKIEHIEKYDDDDLWRMSDCMVPAIIYDPEILLKTESHPIIVNYETRGPFRGATAVDYTNSLKTNQTINIIYRVKKDLYKKSLLNNYKNC